MRCTAPPLNIYFVIWACIERRKYFRSDNNPKLGKKRSGQTVCCVILLFFFIIQWKHPEIRLFPSHLQITGLDTFSAIKNAKETRRLILISFVFYSTTDCPFQYINLRVNRIAKAWNWFWWKQNMHFVVFVIENRNILFFNYLRCKRVFAFAVIFDFFCGSRFFSRAESVI